MSRTRDAHDWSDLPIASFPLSKKSDLHENEKSSLRKARNEALAGKYQVSFNLDSWEKKNNKKHWKRKFYEDTLCPRCPLNTPEDTVHIIGECPVNAPEIKLLVESITKEIISVIPESEWNKEGITLPIPNNCKSFGNFSERDPSIPLKINKPKRGRPPGPARGVTNKKKALKWRKKFLGLLGYVPTELIQKLEKIGGRTQAKEVAKNIAAITIRYTLNAIQNRNKSFGEICKSKEKSNTGPDKDMLKAVGTIT
jgi:hypothetical protein